MPQPQAISLAIGAQKEAIDIGRDRHTGAASYQVAARLDVLDTQYGSAMGSHVVGLRPQYCTRSIHFDQLWSLIRAVTRRFATAVYEVAIWQGDQVSLSKIIEGGTVGKGPDLIAQTVHTEQPGIPGVVAHPLYPADVVGAIGCGFDAPEVIVVGRRSEEL